MIEVVGHIHQLNVRKAHKQQGDRNSIIQANGDTHGTQCRKAKEQVQ